MDSFKDRVAYTKEMTVRVLDNFESGRVLVISQ
jgi:hypothetical protein